MHNKNTRTKIIAEFCQNHNGSFKILEQMIKSAAEAGATYGKIQTIFASDLSKRYEFEEHEINSASSLNIYRPYSAEFKRLKSLELNLDEHEHFYNLCLQNGLIPMTTVFNARYLNQLSKIGFQNIKLASYDSCSYPLMSLIRNEFSKINLFVSTGATTNHEIFETNKFLKNLDLNYYLLHAITLYPAKEDSLFFGQFNLLKNLTSNYGYSDHSASGEDGLYPIYVSIIKGVRVIEKHFTILDVDSTRDGKVSATVADLKKIVDFSNLNKNEQLEICNNFITKNRNLFEVRENLQVEELRNRFYYRGRFTNWVKGIPISNSDPILLDLYEKELKNAK